MLTGYHYHLRAALFTISFLLNSWAFANPVLNNVAAGQARVTQNANSTVVNQSSQKAILNWNNFNIGANEKVHFQQPTGGVALNRISGSQGASQIYGRLTATGQIILINPAGIYFGPSSYVNVGSLIATTANIRDRDFLNGHYQFSKPSQYSGAIVNEGQIIVRDNGLAALVASGVVNKGRIQANLGRVVLASGEAFTIDFSGDQLINFAITQATTKKAVDKDNQTLNAGVSNQGTIIANGGQVLITASAAKGVLDQAINMGGIIQANSVASANGEIILSGGKNGVVQVSGKLLAKGNAAGKTGGTVTVTGNQISLTQNAAVDVSGDAGGGNIYIGGDYQGKGPLQNAQQVLMQSGASLKADALTTGNGGTVIVWSDDATSIYGTLSAQGGTQSGNGGFIETSGKNYLDVNGITVSTYAAKGKWGTWLLDPTNIYIANNQASATGAGMSGTDNSANTGTGSNPETFAASGSPTDSLLLISTLQSALNSTNVVVQTTSAGSGVGDITLVDPLTWTSNNSLTLTADNNININAAITNNNSAALTMTAANDINVNAAITSGALNATATNGNITIAQPINTGSQNVTLTSNSTSGTTPDSILESGSGAIITTGTLNVHSAVPGITLNGNNQVGRFTGSVSGTSTFGGIVFNNTSGSLLTLGAISIQNSPTTKNIVINSNGAILIDGNIIALTFPANIQINALGTITQTAGTQMGNNVRLTAVGGITLASGNIMSNFSASNTGGGDIIVPGNTTILSGMNIASVTNTGGGNINIGFVGPGNMLLGSGVISTTGSGTVTLSAPNSAITTSAGSVSTSSLTASAMSGIAITSASNNVANFTATNTTSGDINFVDSALSLTVGNVVQQSSSSAISIQNSGNVTVAGNIGQASTGQVSLVSTAGSLILNSGLISSNVGVTLANGQASGDVFTNNIGAGALSLGAGANFQLWSYSPEDDFVNLNGNYLQYNASFVDGTAVPSGASGNGLRYRIAPTVSVTLTGLTKVYDGSAGGVTVSAANRTINGVLNNDNLSLTLPTSATFVSPNVGASVGINGDTNVVLNSSVTGANSSGIAAGLTIYGYGVTSVASGVGSITPVTLTYTANTASRTYGASNPTFSGTVTGFVNGETLATATTGTLAFTSLANALSGVGNYAITGSGLSATNYVFVQAAGNSTALAITPATLTYVANPASRTYGASNPALSGTVTGFVNGETQSSSTTGTLGFTTTADALSGVGNYAITGGGLSAANYVFVQAAGNSTALAITPATLTYVANPASRTYGASNPALSGTVTGFVNGETQSSATTGTLGFTTTADALSGVGNYAITGGGLSAANYVFVQAAGNSTALAITPATLTYVANPASRTYGASNPALSGTVTGFVNGETQSGATTGTLAFTTTAGTLSNVGSYAINGGGLSASNYVFVQAAGNSTALTITPATLTVIANAQTKVYGQNDPTLTYSTSGLVASDTVTGALSRPISQATENVGSYAINLGTLTAGSNYTVVYNGANLTITPKSVTVAVTPTSKVYGQSDVSFATSVTPGLVNGLVDGVGIYDSLTGTVTRAAGSRPGVYAFNFSGLNIMHNPNYRVTTTPTNFIIQSTQSQNPGTDIPAANQPGNTPSPNPNEYLQPVGGGNSFINAINNFYQQSDENYWGSLKVGDCSAPTPNLKTSQNDLNLITGQRSMNAKKSGVCEALTFDKKG